MHRSTGNKAALLRFVLYSYQIVTVFLRSTLLEFLRTFADVLFGVLRMFRGLTDGSHVHVIQATYNFRGTTIRKHGRGAKIHTNKFKVL